MVEAGVRFLVESMRDDGGWPIDTNLSTWVTTLSITALDDAAGLAPGDRGPMRKWLLDQQSTREHPFTHAAPGAWAWTPLSGGVPDADDTSGALLALRRLGDPDPQVVAAAAAGVRWLIGHPESRRRHPDVLPRVGSAAVRSQHSRDHRARTARVERLVCAVRSDACSGTCERALNGR